MRQSDDRTQHHDGEMKIPNRGWYPMPGPESRACSGGVPT
jgi:hypothetical protein